jgi:hypothetical protein
MHLKDAPQAYKTFTEKKGWLHQGGAETLTHRTRPG